MLSLSCISRVCQRYIIIRNIVENGVKHHNSNPISSEYDINNNNYQQFVSVWSGMFKTFVLDLTD